MTVLAATWVSKHFRQLDNGLRDNQTQGASGNPSDPSLLNLPSKDSLNWIRVRTLASFTFPLFKLTHTHTMYQLGKIVFYAHVTLNNIISTTVFGESQDLLTGLVEFLIQTY